MVVINLTYFLKNIFPNFIAYRNFIDVVCDLLLHEMQKRYFSWALRSVIPFQQFSSVTAMLSILAYVVTIVIKGRLLRHNTICYCPVSEKGNVGHEPSAVIARILIAFTHRVHAD